MTTGRDRCAAVAVALAAGLLATECRPARLRSDALFWFPPRAGLEALVIERYPVGDSPS